MLLRDLASAPRPAGSAAAAAARARCTHELQQLGFRVDALSFGYSAAPGLYATPLAGILVALLVGAVRSSSVSGQRYAAIATLLIGATLIAIAARWLIRRGVLTVPARRRTGVNLAATRGDAEVPPIVWLAAHVDSKSQLVPTLVRSAGVVLAGLGVGMAALAALLGVASVIVPTAYWTVTMLVTLAGAIPLALSVVGERSNGAFDNASGVVTVLEAARLLDADARVGVLLTDAEELGLAGARAWSRARTVVDVVILNCDGVDDTGAIAVMYSRRGGGGLTDGFVETMRRASASCGVSFSLRRLLPGILTDSVAFADGGARSVTFSRGTLWSLARVHSARDDLSRLHGTGIAETARLLAATAREFADRSETRWKS